MLQEAEGPLHQRRQIQIGLAAMRGATTVLEMPFQAVLQASSAFPADASFIGSRGLVLSLQFAEKCSVPSRFALLFASDGRQSHSVHPGDMGSMDALSVLSEAS